MIRTESTTASRTYAGLLGAPSDVVLDINGQQVPADGLQLSLPSGATLRMQRDGAWIYRPATTARRQAGVDAFDYRLQTPSGLLGGQISVLVTPPISDARPYMRADGQSGDPPGTGSAADPWRIRFPIVTATPLLLELRTDVVAEHPDLRAVVVLETPPGIVADVLRSGVVRIQTQAGLVGRASFFALVETPTGYAEWVEVELEIFPACMFTDSRSPTPGCCDPPASSPTGTVRKAIIPAAANVVLRGTTRPGSQITARLSAETNAPAFRAVADAAGYWSLIVRGAKPGQRCPIEIQATSSGVGCELQIDPPADAGYREAT